jgi:hypothetical protein
MAFLARAMSPGVPFFLEILAVSAAVAGIAVAIYYRTR